MVRRDQPQPVAADLSKAAVLFPSPWGEGQGEGSGGVETLAWVISLPSRQEFCGAWIRETWRVGKHYRGRKSRAGIWPVFKFVAGDQ